MSSDGSNYDVTGEGDNEELIVDTTHGDVFNYEDPIRVGSTVMEIYQYVDLGRRSVGMPGTRTTTGHGRRALQGTVGQRRQPVRSCIDVLHAGDGDDHGGPGNDDVDDDAVEHHDDSVLDDDDNEWFVHG